MKKKITIWAFIPARSNSKTLKNKNLRKIRNKTLIEHSIKIALKSKFDRIIFSSDSQKYLNIANKYKNISTFLRPKKYSTAKSSDLEVFKNFLLVLDKKNIKTPDIFVHLRPTTPLRDHKLIIKIIKKFLAKKNLYTSLRSVSLMSNPSYKTVRIIDNKLCSLIDKDFHLDKFNLPKEFFAKTYLPNGYVDIIKTTNIRSNFLHGNKVMPYIIDNFNSDIDNYEDYIRVKKYMERRR